jgi:anthranilate synthase component 2
VFRTSKYWTGFGGNIVRAKTVMHGRLSDMYHSNTGIFSNLPSPFSATRYHSLVIDQATLPDCLDVTCWTKEADGSIEEIMGVKHKILPLKACNFTRIDPEPTWSSNL